jgi:large subunit ribosomal protein L15
MKIHDLRPAPGSHRPRTRVGRGIAAGKGKTAGRGTKGQKARAGGSIPPWFEGGQTPLHQRIPKLRGFKPRFTVEYEVVNLGSIASLVELGAFESGEPGATSSRSKTPAPITVNQDILRGVGLVRTLNKPLKILGGGELSTPLFVVADAFSKSAISKIEAAGGSVSVLEVPSESRPAIGVKPKEAATPTATLEPAAAEAQAEVTVESTAPDAQPAATQAQPAEAEPAAPEAPLAVEAEAPPVEEAKPTRRGRARAGTVSAVSDEAPDEAETSAERPTTDDTADTTEDGA